MSQVLSTKKSRAAVAIGVPLGIILVWGLWGTYSLFHGTGSECAVWGVVWLTAVLVSAVIYGLITLITNWVYAAKN